MFDADKSYQFLLSLNDDLYSQIRDQILAMEPLPSLEKIFNIVTQEEQHKKLMVGRNDCTESAFTVNQQQQQLPNSSRVSGVWGDPDVHDRTPMRTRHIERSVPTDPQKTFLNK